MNDEVTERIKAGIRESMWARGDGYLAAKANQPMGLKARQS